METNMSKVDQNLADIFGISHEVVPVEVEQTPKGTNTDVQVIESSVNLELTPDAEEDYRLARRTFRDLIKKGNEAIDGITDVARASEHPRAYEVLSTLIKNVSDVTKDLFELQKKTKELKGEDRLKEAPVKVDKAVFVGTTAELLQKIKEQKQS